MDNFALAINVGRLQARSLTQSQAAAIDGDEADAIDRDVDPGEDLMDFLTGEERMER
jgi:hypothetical protein